MFLGHTESKWPRCRGATCSLSTWLPGSRAGQVIGDRSGETAAKFGTGSGTGTEANLAAVLRTEWCALHVVSHHRCLRCRFRRPTYSRTMRVLKAHEAADVGHRSRCSRLTFRYPVLKTGDLRRLGFLREGSCGSLAGGTSY